MLSTRSTCGPAKSHRFPSFDTALANARIADSEFPSFRITMPAGMLLSFAKSVPTWKRRDSYVLNGYVLCPKWGIIAQWNSKAEKLTWCFHSIVALVKIGQKIVLYSFCYLKFKWNIIDQYSCNKKIRASNDLSVGNLNSKQIMVKLHLGLCTFWIFWIQRIKDMIT